MILIAHRGNINGKNPEKENHPDYIIEALNLGYDVEIDVWYVNNKLYLGHDNPQYEIDLSLLEECNYPDYRRSKLWIHTKNIEAAHELSQYWEEEDGMAYNLFFHNNDDCVITTYGNIWTYPGKLICGKRSVAVLPELVPDWNISQAGGICSDFIEQYKVI